MCYCGYCDKRRELKITGSNYLSAALAWNAPAGEGNQALAKDALLDLVAETQTLEPQGRTRMFVLLPDVWGQERSGPVWVTVSGPRIHSTTHKKVKGYSTWIDVEAKPEYGTGFFVTVTVPLSNGKFAEATRAFSIVNKDRQLTIIRSTTRLFYQFLDNQVAEKGVEERHLKAV